MAFDANDLSPHEQFVVERTRLGEVADFTPMAGPGGAKPPVRAGFLRKLMLGLDENWIVRTPGVRIKGARIEGALDLTDCSGAGGAGLPALALAECDIPEPVDLSHARLARVSLSGSRLRSLTGVEAQIDGEFNLSHVGPIDAAGSETLVAILRGVRIDGDILAHGAKFARTAGGSDTVLMLQAADIAGGVLLDRGFEAFGCVWLAGARIGGVLQLDGAQLLNRTDNASGLALVADGARIGNSVRFVDACRCEGVVRLVGATIGGDIDFASGSFRNEGGEAVLLTRMTVEGNLSLSGKIVGECALDHARIGHNLDLRGAEIANRTTPRGDTHGRAVSATAISVGGAALFHGTNIKGEVFLADARIGGYLAFGGGRFINGRGWAIRAPNARVGGNLTFKIADDGYAPHGQKTVIEGGAKFDRARIDGSLAWVNLELRGPGPDGAKGALFSFADATIAGPLQARGLTTQQDARIDASGATCAALDDDIKAGWGVEGARLDLEGFVYGRIEANERWRERLGWLKRARGERFSPQPFGQAAAVYARAGRREDARRILLAQHDMRTAHASAGPLTWALSSLFGLIAGYGLAPIRVVRTLALFLAIGVAGVLVANAQGALVTPAGRACNGAIEPALYAIDVALPVIDLGQDSRCAPGRAARADLPTGTAISETSDWRLFEGVALWRWAHALYALLGAILTALAVITFSGIMKPKDD